MIRIATVGVWGIVKGGEQVINDVFCFGYRDQSWVKLTEDSSSYKTTRRVVVQPN